MTLKEHIEDISNQLKQGAFANERECAVSQRIINKIYLCHLLNQHLLPMLFLKNLNKITRKL